MILSIQQHEVRYVQLFIDIYDTAKEKYPEIDTIDITFDSKPMRELKGNVHVSKGTKEDEGKYKVSIHFLNSSDIMRQSICLGLTMVYFDYKFGEFDFSNMNQKKKIEFENIFHNLYN